MAVFIENIRAVPFPSVYLNGQTRYTPASTLSGSVLFFNAQVGADPLSAAGTRGLYVDNTDRLSYWNGTTSIRLTGAGGVATTWEGLYGVDATFALTTGTWTITQAGAFAMLTLNKTNVGAGAVIAITNSGTGNDITGNASNWLVTAAGDATVASLVSNGAITCTAISDVTGGATLQVDGNGAGGVNIGSTSTGAITLGRATTVTTGGLTVTAGGLTVSAGQYAHTDTSNTAAGFLLTNNTVTTYGVGGASTGVAILRSTSLTTGSLLSLQLTETALVGGFYMRCFDVTAGANVFTLGEDGAVVITGADSTAMLTVTAGDVVVTLGSITVTNDDDNALTVDITNNTTTTGGMARFQGSGVFTGTGASSFFLVSPSGLTTGTAFAITAAGLTTGLGGVVTVNAMTTGSALRLTSTGTITTTGKMLEVIADSATTAGASAGDGLVAISGDALTTGTAFDVTSTSAALAAGEVANFEHIASSATLVAKTGQLVDVTSSRTNTALAGTVADDYDALSIVRTSVQNGAGGTLTAAGAVLYLENVATQTAGTLTDTANGLEVVMDADGTGTGVSITHNATLGPGLTITSSATTLAGGVFQVTANSVNSGAVGVITCNGLTTGTGLRITSTGAVVTTGELLDIIGNSATTTTGLVRISGTGLTDGQALTVTGGGANMTATGDLLDLNMGAATVGNGIDLTTTGAYTGAGVFLLEADTATTGTIVSVSADALTTGTCLSLTNTGGVMTGAGKMLEIVATAATTATALVDMTFAGLTTGTAMRITANGLTTGAIINLVSSVAGQTAGSVSYLACNNGATDVFSVGVEGHLEFRQSTAPTIAVTTANGITGATVVAGSTDVCGKITMTGTSTGSSQVTLTFNQAFANAPRVIVIPANAAAANPNTQWFVDAVSTTTFRMTVAAGGTYAATPNFSYYCIETGVADLT